MVAGVSPLVDINARRGSTWSRAPFLWASSYLVLYCLPFPAGAIYGADWLEELYQGLCSAVVPWVGAHVIGLPEPPPVVTNGDSTYAYVRLFVVAVLATLATVGCSVAQRRRVAYAARLDEWIRIYIRYCLAWEMFRYGIHKLFDLQFVGGPTLSRMLETYGESSPFALAWTFMGSSTAYAVISGVAEALGGALLVFRRTATLGALLVSVVMANVVLLNFCYDVPVKIHSFHVLLLAAFLLWPDAKRLVGVAMGGAAEAARTRAPFASPRGRLAWIASKTIFVPCLIVPCVLMNVDIAKRYNQRHPLFGSYEVDADSTPNGFRTIVIDEIRVLAIRRIDGTLQRFQIARDPDPDALRLAPFRRPGEACRLRYRLTDDRRLALTGTIDGETVDLKLRKVEPPPFVLKTRGFHWVNEYPFDR